MLHVVLKSKIWAYFGVAPRLGERGLKFFPFSILFSTPFVAPRLGERGLKYWSARRSRRAASRSPLRGAWIEIAGSN